jgi:hypothetical protein
MIAYVQQIAKEIARRLQAWQTRGNLDQMHDRIATLAEELDRLDPRDFIPGTQFDFVECRRKIRALKITTELQWHEWSVSLKFARANLREKQQQFETLEENRADKRSRRKEAVPSDTSLRLSDEITNLNAAIKDSESVFSEPKELCDHVLSLLDMYAGQGSQSVTRSFAFVANAHLRAIIERDYKELSLNLLPGHAWKSAVIMAGSILEAILHDQLTRDRERVTLSMAWPDAPKNKGVVRDIEKDDRDNEWVLAKLIGCAAHLTILDKSDAGAIHRALRDYRNFVHPRVEIRNAHQCTEAEATMAKGTLDMICNRLVTDPCAICATFWGHMVELVP